MRAHTCRQNGALTPVRGRVDGVVPWSCEQFLVMADQGFAYLVDEHSDQRPRLLSSHVGLIWESVAPCLPLPEKSDQPDPHSVTVRLAAVLNPDNISQPMIRYVHVPPPNFIQSATKHFVPFKEEFARLRLLHSFSH